MRGFPQSTRVKTQEIHKEISRKEYDLTSKNKHVGKRIYEVMNFVSLLQNLVTDFHKS